jgi:Kef-type K+ transport system membrane component KefB/Trk K+ transport system NAD-binding subunit
MSHGGTFYEISIILGLATLLAAVGQKLRQPLIIMFLLAGILAGPSFLGVIESHEQIELLAQIGISLLLFIVGLKLDLNLIRSTGPVALATGMGQIIFTSAIGFVIALGFGMSFMSSAYVAVALTFSSTIIIVKLLSDKGEIDSLHGQIAVGFLIVQDIAAILALVALTTFGSRMAQEESALVTTIFIAVKGLGMLTVVGLLMRFVLPGLVRRLAQSQEMLVIFAIAWAVFLGAASDYLGFSKEVGAFLAGISLASTPYRDAIGARLVSLRDFLLLFFFIDLGARLEWSAVGTQLVPAFWFSLFVLVGNPLIVLAIMGAMGYRRRTGFLAGLTVAQISEFSLIVAALGLSLGHIDKETMGLITLVGVVTICVSTYMILYSGSLYRILEKPLKIFERKNPHREAQTCSLQDSGQLDAIMLGLGRYGSGLAAHLLARKKSIVGVDFDPSNLERWRSIGVPVLYGDMADPEMLDHLPLSRARWVISTVRSRELNLPLLHLLKDSGYKGKIALTAHDEAEAATFRKAGADVVFRPFTDASEQAADALTHAMDILPEDIDWPIAFQEIRIQSGSMFAGKKVRDIPLRANTGASILAVSRAGRVHYDPGPDFQVYPGDRLVIMGDPKQIKQAGELLNEHMAPTKRGQESDRFELAKIIVAQDSDKAGRTLMDLGFRQRYSVTVVGIRRGSENNMSPGPDTVLLPGDEVMVVGTTAAIKAMRENEII